MKNVLIATALAVLAASTFVSTASAQRAGGPADSGSRSSSEGRGDPSGCVPGALCRPKVKKIVALGEGCGCTIKKVRIGGRISYIKDCYVFDVKTNMERYCQPWERTSN